MKEKIANNTHLIAWSFFATFIWGLVAHGFIYLNTDLSHDSLMIYQNDNLWKMELGRYLIPLYRNIRSPYTAPWLIGVLSLVWLSFGVYFLIKIFNIDRLLYIVFVAGLLATNYSLSLTNATYLEDSDVHMLSLVLCITGVFLLQKYFWGFLPGGLCVAGSLALYQANLPMALVLFILIFIQKIFDDESLKKILLFCGQVICCMIFAFLFFKLGIWYFMTRKGINLGDSYNSIKGAGDFTGVNIGELFINTIKYVYDFFISLSAYNIARVRNASVCIIVLITALFAVLLIKKKIAVWKKFLTALAMLCIPFVINIVFFISKGMQSAFHHLMICPFIMVYVSLIIFLNCWDEGQVKKTSESENRFLSLGSKGIKGIAFLCLGIILLNNVTFANDIYLKKNLESQATLSIMTRIVDRMENTEGYVPGETEVVIEGSLSESSLNRHREGFQQFNSLVGQTLPFSVTYYQTYEWYFHYILGYPVKASDSGIVNEYKKMEEVQAMPVFPAEGCTRMIDGRLVVKLGNITAPNY